MAGTVRQLKTGGWIADVNLGGQRRTGRAPTKAEALRRKKELLEQLLAETSAAASPKAFTMAEARNLALATTWRGTAYERTAAIYSQAAVDHWGPQAPVSAVSVPTVEDWRGKLLAGGNTPATVNRKLSAIRTMLRCSVEHGYLLALPTLPKQLKPGGHKDRVISDEERDRLCAWFTQAGQPAAADLLVFLLESCCRWGEAERLRGQDVDLGRARVTFWQTKSGKPRSVPLTWRAIGALGPHLPAVRSHRVWPYTYGQFSDLLARAVAGVGIAEPGLTIHTTRHTCASKLASRGVSLHKLMSFGGWTSLQAVQRYLHLHTDALAVCVAALEEI